MQRGPMPRWEAARGGGSLLSAASHGASEARACHLRGACSLPRGRFDSPGRTLVRALWTLGGPGPGLGRPGGRVSPAAECKHSALSAQLSFQ